MWTMASNRRVLIGISGGIDSTAACLMLREQGYEPVGMTMRVWDDGADVAQEAAALAARLGMEHHVVDARKEFEETVVADFVNEYLEARTPNPCVMCNRLFKFRLLIDCADKHDCAMIATGHYVRLVTTNGHLHVRRGVDDKKDQSYFLWRLDESVLRRCVFPLGNYRKEEVRDYLRSRGFDAKAESKESMEVCFVPGDYRDFLKKHCDTRDIKEGWFVAPDGKRLGKHKGLPYYTIGQRKGLGIALGKPAYVLKLNSATNTVMLGDKEGLKAEYMLVERCNSSDIDFLLHGDRQLSVMIRYRGLPIPCRIADAGDGSIVVKFLAEAESVTPGQSAVFYDGDTLLGGVYIANQRMLGKYLSDGYMDKLQFK